MRSEGGGRCLRNSPSQDTPSLEQTPISHILQSGNLSANFDLLQAKRSSPFLWHGSCANELLWEGVRGKARGSLKAEMIQEVFMGQKAVPGPGRVYQIRIGAVKKKVGCGHCWEQEWQEGWSTVPCGCPVSLALLHPDTSGAGL